MKKTAQNVTIKVAIVEAGLTQQKAAQQARIEPQKLSHVIHGRRSLNEKERGRLAKALGKTEAELFPSEA